MKIQLKSGDGSRTFVVLRQGNRLRVTPEGGAGAGGAASAGGAGGAGETIELEIHDAGAEGGIVFSRGSARFEAASVTRGTARQLWLDGRVLTYSRDLGGAAPVAATEVGMTATIPSVVLEILVAPGDPVHEGQKLILLESMKMVIPILSSRAGVVRAMLCREGESVQPGVPLVEIDEQDGADTAG